MRLRRKYLLLLGLGLCLYLQAGGICWSQVTERVSVDSFGVEGDKGSAAPSSSSDGRHVAFESSATNLVAGDTNGKDDIFVRDRQTGSTTRVSIHSDGIPQGDDRSYSPSISGDGRYVAFESEATNFLGAGNDTNGWPDIFVRDRDADGNGTYDEPGPGGVSIVRVSVYSDETESIDPSNDPSISADGRYVAFASGGDLDLTAIEILNIFDVFVHDRDTDENGIYDELGGVSTIRVSDDSDGNEANQPSNSPSISANGRYVAFESSATDLVAGGTNGNVHIFVRDLLAGTTTLVSVDSGGGEANDGSSSASISGDGRYVAFESIASNLVIGDGNGFSDVFVHDRDADGNGTYDEPGPGAISTVRVSVTTGGGEANGDSSSASISSDGRYVSFETLSNNLVPDDNNGSADVFVHDLQTGTTTRVSVDLDGVEGNGNSNNPSISADSSSVTFESDATNLVGVGNDNNGAPDIFADDLQAGAGEGGGSDSSGVGCFISTAADGIL